MQPQYRTWNGEHFARHLAMRHKANPNVRFAFVLGAGASKGAGIRLADEYVDEWLADIQQREDPGSNLPVHLWGTAENLGIPGFEYGLRSSFYFHVYDVRFPEAIDGSEYFKHDLNDREPSRGHFQLARIVYGEPPIGERHSIVLTTNFDRLAETAMTMLHPNKPPLVYGDSSSPDKADVRSRTPHVMKLHNDITTEPLNRQTEMAYLAETWHKPLRAIFANYAPIFIGYNGHDHTLWDFLQGLSPEDMPHGLYWGAFTRPGAEHAQEYQLRSPIVDLVNRLNGQVFSHHGFDDFMACLAKGFGLPPLQLPRKPKGAGAINLGFAGIGAVLALAAVNFAGPAPANKPPDVVGWTYFETEESGQKRSVPAPGVRLLLKSGGEVLAEVQTGVDGKFRVSWGAQQPESAAMIRVEVDPSDEYYLNDPELADPEGSSPITIQVPVIVRQERKPGSTNELERDLDPARGWSSNSSPHF